MHGLLEFSRKVNKKTTKKDKHNQKKNTQQARKKKLSVMDFIKNW